MGEVCGKCGTDKVRVHVTEDGSWITVVCEACQITTYIVKKYYNPKTFKMISPKQYQQLVKEGK